MSRTSLCTRVVMLSVSVASLNCGEPTQPNRLTQISIDGPDTLFFGALGTGVQLTATVTVSEGAVPVVDWRTDNVNVATVQPGPVLVTVGNGSARIIARAGDAADTIMAVVEQIPAMMTFGLEPGPVVVDEPFLVPVTIVVGDSNGIAVQTASQAVQISLEDNPGNATLGGTTSRPMQNGIAEFADLTVDTPGDGYTFRATGLGFDATSQTYSVVAEPDLVRFHNAADQPVGVMLDGQSSLFVNDLTQITNDSTVTTVLGPGPYSDEIVAFTEGRPPAVTTSPIWSAGVDTVDVVFRDVMRIPVTAWIVAGPFESLRDRAISQAATTTAVWADERMGLEFEEFEIVDATTDPDADRLLSTTTCNQRTLAQTAIGERTGRINVYYVSVVDNGHDRGYSCGSVIFMADRSGHELLVHEIGHSFGLGHIDNANGYDQTNVMHSASSRRAYLTEGQVFRQHYNTFSALNDLYGFRPIGQRSCFDSTVNEQCMSLIRRIWADGGFEPN